MPDRSAVTCIASPFVNYISLKIDLVAMSKSKLLLLQYCSQFQMILFILDRV